MSVSIEADTTSGAPSSTLRSDGRVAWWARRIVDAALGFVLVRSALAHLADPYFFLSSVYDYQLTGVQIGEAVALLLPHMELAVGSCLVLGVWRRAAVLVAAAMFITFLALQVSAWSRGLSISCGCFGASGSEQIGLESLFFVGVLAFAAGASAFAHKQ